MKKAAHQDALPLMLEALASLDRGGACEAACHLQLSIDLLMLEQARNHTGLSETVPLVDPMGPLNRHGFA